MISALSVRSVCRQVIAVCAMALLSACGSGGSGGGSVSTGAATGAVTGQVVSAAAGNTPVAGAIVRTTAGTTTSGNDGSFTVPAPANDRAVVHVVANGFAEAFPVTRVVSGQMTTIGVKLLPIGVMTTVNVANGGTVTVPNSTAQIELPTNGLVPQNGGPAAGTVNVSVTPINPAVDPNLMPGDFTGVSAGGTTPIESFGALVVDLRDNAGNRYNLAAGKTSTIRIPLGTQNPNPPATIPLWYFDETTGLWKEEGSATLQGSAPNQYYEGTVTHFSAWNADDRLLRTWVEGCVRDANGQPVVMVEVRSTGVDYTGVASAWTNSEGVFRVGVRRGSSATISVLRWDWNSYNYETISNAVTVTSSPNDPVDFVRTLPNCIVVNPGVLTITTQVLPGGNVGTAYNQTLAASGGVPGYAWSLNAASDLTALSSVGLSLNAAGVIAGTPTAAGTITMTVKVTDSVNGTVTKQFTFTISPAGVVPISITTPSPLPGGTVGTTYNLTLAATGGTGTRVWSDAGGLPTWLTLNPSTGQLSGTPTAQGTFAFTIQVQDSSNPQQSNQRQFSLTINSVGGGGGGTLTVTGAPASVGGSFVTNPSDIVVQDYFGFRGIAWGEVVSGGHVEGVAVTYELSTGNLLSSSFFISDGGVYKQWSCYTPFAFPPPGTTPCSGITWNVSTGVANFSNVTLGDIEKLVPAITLNGTLSVTP